MNLAIGVAVIVPLAGMTVMQRAKITSLRNDIVAAEQESRRLKPQIDKIRALQQQRADVEQRLITVQMLARDRFLPVQIMDELANQTPDHMWFTKFRHADNGSIELEGKTFSNVLVSELMSRMEEADIFQDVALTVTKRSKEGDGRLMDFVLTAKIKP
jgi:Tfp pilus assembly protein PilN